MQRVNSTKKVDVSVQNVNTTKKMDAEKEKPATTTRPTLDASVAEKDGPTCTVSCRKEQRVNIEIKICHKKDIVFIKEGYSKKSLGFLFSRIRKMENQEPR